MGNMVQGNEVQVDNEVLTVPVMASVYRVVSGT